MPRFMIVWILDINVLNLSWKKKKCQILRNMEPLRYSRLWALHIPRKNGKTICKQWRPWSDAAFRGVWSGSALFPDCNELRILNTHCRFSASYLNGHKFSLRKHTYSNILKISTKTENFQTKNSYFSYFCSKHRLWVLVRTVSLRRF